MAQGQTKGKYWLGNNPNAQITNAEITELGSISETELDLLDGAVAGTVAASKAVIYSSGGGIAATLSPFVTGKYNVIADAGDDVTITSLASGNEYFFGTTDGAPGSSDGNNAFTFKLPTPAGIGETIKITCLSAAAYGSLLGFVTTLPASETIRYIANDNGVFIESAVTATGVNGTANTMVKLNATHFQIGDTYEAVSLSTTSWLLTINGRNGLIAAGDIAVDPGNSSGYID